jgi:hypothetical protein
MSFSDHFDKVAYDFGYVMYESDQNSRFPKIEQVCPYAQEYGYNVMECHLDEIVFTYFIKVHD